MNRLTLSILFLVVLSACEKQSPFHSTSSATLPRAVTTTTENFETGTKAAYAAANVTLSTGVWNFSDALLGNLSTDHKDGAQAARVRNSGTMTMQFDIPGGANSVSVKHAVFGSDG